MELEKGILMVFKLWSWTGALDGEGVQVGVQRLELKRF